MGIYRAKGSLMGFGSGASSVNGITGSLWNGAWIAAAVVGVFTAILILYPAVRHRKKIGAKFPTQTQYNVPVEIAYTVIPFLIVAVLFFFTAKDESKIVNARNNPNITHTIEVTGFQWSWQFKYDELGANADKAKVTGTPDAPPTLVVPLNEPVKYLVRSNDVVHGFWIPAFMDQVEAIPGVTNVIAFTAKQLGTFPGRCNILCGRAHTYMIFNVKVVTPEQYQSYLNSLVSA